MVIAFRMLYHFTQTLKTSPNILSSLDLNFVLNKNDNHKHRNAYDMAKVLNKNDNHKHRNAYDMAICMNMIFSARGFNLVTI